MKCNLTTPCNDCPFRKNSLPGWLGAWESPEQLFGFIITVEREFPCHLTMTDKDEKDKPESEMSYCRGAVMFMKKLGKLPRNPVLAKMVNSVNREELDNILDHTGFFTHHKK